MRATVPTSVRTSPPPTSLPRSIRTTPNSGTSSQAAGDEGPVAGLEDVQGKGHAGDAGRSRAGTSGGHRAPGHRRPVALAGPGSDAPRSAAGVGPRASRRRRLRVGEQRAAKPSTNHDSRLAWSPFWIITKVMALPGGVSAKPARALTSLSVPVLAWTDTGGGASRPCACGACPSGRRRPAPRPMTESGPDRVEDVEHEAGRAPGWPGRGPEPSFRARPVGGVARCEDSVSMITSVPAAVVPSPARASPSSRVSSSAVVLSESVIISPTISDMGTESMRATSVSVGGRPPAGATAVDPRPRVPRAASSASARPAPGGSPGLRSASRLVRGCR